MQLREILFTLITKPVSNNIRLECLYSFQNKINYEIADGISISN